MREIADKWDTKRRESRDLPTAKWVSPSVAIEEAAREAYAAGRAKAFEEAETIARGAQSSNETLPGILLAMLAKQAQWIADAIAARAKETP